MKQFSLPVIINGKNTEILEKVSLNKNEYDEAWIQKICFENPNILPIDEIETTFSGMIPLCREMSVNSGFIDLIYINEYGFITIGECKLWRNPESRRKVIGQILDYAKDINNLNYDDFEKKCLKARKKNEKCLFDIISLEYPDIEEHIFIDNVQKNINKGRFLLTIIGDGIQENMEEITKYINNSGNMNFTLSLIELPVYKIPKEEKLIITPRIIAKTKEIERTIFIESRNNNEEVRIKNESKSISESVFYERLIENIGKAEVDKFKSMLEKLNENFNLIAKLGRGKRLSLNIKSPDDVYNFASIQENGEVWFYGIVNKTEEIGNKNIGIEYLEELSVIINGEFDKKPKPWTWGVKRDGKYINIKEYLYIENSWIELIEKTITMIRKEEENTL